MALGWLWWRAWVSVDAVDAAAFGVAGVALGDMDRPPLSFLPSPSQLLHARARTHARTHTHTLADETEEAILALLQAANVEKR